MGIDGSVEAEGHDRHNTTLPGLQPTLVTKVLGTPSRFRAPRNRSWGPRNIHDEGYFWAQ